MENNVELQNVAPINSAPEKKRYTFNKNHAFLGLAVVAIIITAVLLFSKTSFSNMIPGFAGKSTQAVADETVKYINENLIVEGKTAVLESVAEESGMIKMSIKIDQNADDIYVTKDGKLLFLEELKVPAN